MRVFGGWTGWPAKRANRATTLSVLLAIQSAAAVFFLIDIAGDVGNWEFLPSETAHHAVEIGATLTLMVGIALTALEIRAVLRRQSRVEDQLRAASGAFFDVIHEHFDRWALTPAERDVALLTLRGLSIAEIAAARETRNGTVKAQCASVYSKAGVSNRQQLLSLFLDELLAAGGGEACQPAAGVG